MKKTLFSLAVAASLLTLSCNKEPVNENTLPAAEGGEVAGLCFTASFETVKSTLNDSQQPIWVAGDVIGVTSAQDNNVQCALTDAATGTFSGANINGSAPYYAVYPWNASFSFAGSVVSASVPAVQQLAGGQKIAPGAMVAACKSENTALAFKNCTSLMRLDIPRSDIKSIKVETTKSGEYLAGDFTMDVDATDPVVTPVAASASASVTLLPEGEAFAAGSYYIALLPAQYTGLKITFTNTANETVVATKSTKTACGRSEGLSWGNFFTYSIGSAEALIAWSQSAPKFTKWDTVTLTDNIALTASQAAQYVEAVDFCGTFNGGNHYITGLTTPLFGDLYGIVSDLDLTANVNYNGTDSRIKGIDYGIGILAHYIKTDKNADAAVTNVTTRGSLTIDGLTKTHAYQVGGVAASSNGVPLTGCKNYADITIESVNVGANAFRVAGVSGVLQTSLRASSTDCKNFGAVTVNSVTSSKDVAVGGVFGLVASAPMTISNCDNAGAVSVSYSDIGSITWNAVGGIVGDSGQALTITGCNNTGDITNANENEKATIDNVKYSTGGVAGRLTEAAIVSNCSSSGNVTAVVYAGGILGTNKKFGLTITACKSSGTMTITGGDNYSAYCGGLAGQLSGTIEKSYSTMTITTSQSGKLQKALGGLIGGVRENSGTTTNISESYFDGHLDIRSQGGGLIGASQRNLSIQNCYSAGTLVNFAGFAGGLIGYINNGALATISNCYSTMNVSNTYQGANNALSGLIGGSDTATNKWDLSGLLAWNEGLSFKTSTETDGVILGRFHSGASEAATSAAGCWYRNDLSYTKATTARTPGDDADVTSSPGSARYDGKRAASGVSCSQKATEIGWDGTTIWNLSGSYPVLRNVVE
ncbi:MAG: hypothetical protein J6Y32_04345 [Bacteroidales bacterium]|nr:hypothetical protein [Bacteroidales bacterium]